MTETEALTQAAERYRNDGYLVSFSLPKEQLPEPLRRHAPAFVASRNGKSMLVEVWTRGGLNDLPPGFLPPGWGFDVVLLPPPEQMDVPGDEATPEFTERLLNELDELLPRGALRARFLLAWSAAEAAMRVAARREGVAGAQLPSQLVAQELVTAGLLSHQQLRHFESVRAVRDRLAHGVPTNDLQPDQVEFLTSLARSLSSSSVTATT